MKKKPLFGSGGKMRALGSPVFQIPSVVRRMEILLATALGTKVVNSLPRYCCLTLILTLTAAVSFNTA